MGGGGTSFVKRFKGGANFLIKSIFRFGKAITKTNIK